MVTMRRSVLALYVDRGSSQWVVLDADGNFWLVSPTDENAWDHRQPFNPTAETELEPVPGHYKYLLGIPA